MQIKPLAFYFFYCLIGFQSLNAAPNVTAVSPRNGAVAGGNTVTIVGTEFTGTTDVNFGFRPATTFSVLDDNTISATVPVGTVGAVDVTVTALGITSPTSPDDFYTYTATAWNGITSGTTPNQVALFDTGTNTFNTFIPLPATSLSSVISPDGTRIYTANSSPDGVSVIDVATNTIMATIPTTVGSGAFDIIINPSGTRIYVSNEVSGYVTVIDTTTNTVITDVFVGGNLGALSITPDGSTVYVSNFSFGGIIAIDTATNAVGTAIFTGYGPGMISITPDGVKAFVSSIFSDTISVIDLASQAITNTINLPTGAGPYGSSILPNGVTLYVANINNSTITVIDVASEVITTTISLSDLPFWVVSTPDSEKVYVINETNDNVIPIDVATNTVGTPFNGAGGNLQDIVMSPDPAPVAIFSATPQLVGIPTSFNASDSFSPIGTIVSYAWDFGDGTVAITPSPLIDHTYLNAGVYNVTLRVKNSAGTSTFQIFSSRFMSNNGGPSAARTQTIESLPTPPSHLVGYQDLFQTPYRVDIINVLKWDPPVEDWTPVCYKIYRDLALTDLIHTVPGNAPHEFFNHNRHSHTNYTYYMVSVSSSGATSDPVNLTIPSRF
jgi:YVTN family beta-propeller protein